MGMYQKWGVGVPADIGDSFDYIYMASHGGNAWASRELANIYLQGSLGFIYRIVGLIYVLYIVPFIVISYLIDKKNPRIIKMIDPLRLVDPIQMMLRDGW